MDQVTTEYETQHLTAISDNHSIQESTEVSDEEKIPGNNDILSSWNSATNEPKDIEVIQHSIKECWQMDIDAEKIMTMGLRVMQKGKWSTDIIAPLMDENSRIVAICNLHFDLIENTSYPPNLQ
ncbi:MAG: hypothetical protein HOD37_13820, partial [Bacteroidetes bacterium]|nr:hypothetical protein [Bacteroidota bacterium]